MKSNPLPGEYKNQRDAHLAGLIALGLVLFIFEAFIPKPLPWLKFGLANIVTLIALFWYGNGSALLVSITRIFIGSLFTGNLLTPGFILSLGGGLFAVLAMIIFYQTRLFGVWGVSLAGAASHNIGQVLFGYVFIFDNPVIFYLLPYLILYSVISGTLIGFLSYQLIRRLKKEFAF